MLVANNSISGEREFRTHLKIKKYIYISVGSQSSKVKFADKNSKHWGWDGQKHVLFYFGFFFPP